MPSVPITQALFPICMAITKRWIKKGNDLVSPITLLILQPDSFKRENVSGPKGPDVSTATGWMECDGSRLLYFALFLVSAIAATAPASLVAQTVYEGA